MKRQLIFVSILVLVAFAVTGQENKYLKAFPVAKPGMVRFVINLPHKDRGEDNNFQVELIVGKKMLTDGVNLVRMSGTIEKKILKGWGFSYYEVEKFGPAISTRMAPIGPDVQEKIEFVAIPSIQIPYNSRIPLVVYVPKGGEVRYKIWTVSDTVINPKIMPRVKN